MVAPRPPGPRRLHPRSEEHTSELQSQSNLVCRLLLEKKKTFLTRYISFVCYAAAKPMDTCLVYLNPSLRSVLLPRMYLRPHSVVRSLLARTCESLLL